MLNNTITWFGMVPVTSRVIYNPAVLAPATEPAFALPDHFVLYAGEVSQRKGACILAHAAAEFLREYPALHLVYAGALDSHADIHAQITTALGKDLLDRVHFLGRLTRGDLATCMRKATLFASPSLLESCSLVTIEAMLSGLPGAGPFPELVTHNETGYIVAPNDPISLAAAVATLMDHPELRASLGKKAKLIAGDRFSLSRCLGATEAVYNELLAAGGRPV
jgi:glycosyltransferase involved in cell wall biosynthesis